MNKTDAQQCEYHLKYLDEDTAREAIRIKTLLGQGHIEEAGYAFGELKAHMDPMQIIEARDIALGRVVWFD